jgi:FlaA1/EpsC-like NDP-sugar epimerase
MAEKDKENVAIYGAGAAGVQLMEALRQSSEFRVVLFIDDNPELDGKNLGGVLIYSLKRASTKIKKLKIGTLLLAIPSNIETVRQRVFNLLPNHPLRVKTIPSISSLIYGGSTITDLKEIRVEDLLGRAPVQYNYDLMAKNITGKNILITGAGGSIGSELCRQIIQWRPNQIILLDVSEFATYAILEELRNLPLSNKTKIIGLVGSVQDRKLVKRVFDRFEINTVYHTAAYKHVPLMEQNVMQCIENNVFGTLNLAEAASTAGVQNFILVSTDKAVNPTNFMGASKRLAELICQTLQQNHQNTRFSIVRFGNVLGSSGSVVPLFKRQIENGGPITLSHPDVTRYFMTMREAAQLVIQAGSLSKGGDVFVLDMGQPVKILDLAKKMITLAGLRPTWDGKGATQDGKIRITISGLRPGEKMFEELAYGDHLLPTVHPRINTSVETAMSEDELKTLLDNLRIALLNGDHEALYETIACVSLGVASINSSTDSFLGPRLENDHSPSQTYLET